MLISLLNSADICDCYGFNLIAAQLQKLKHKNVRVQQFFIFHKFNEPYPKHIIDELVQLCSGSDLIGISLLSSAFRNSIQLTSAFRDKIGCPIIWGGKHPSVDPTDSIKYPDMIGISEGEDTLLEVVENMLENRSCDNIQGLWLRKPSGEIIKNPLRPLETNLDRYDFPDYSLEDKFILDRKTLHIRPVEIGDFKILFKVYPTMITRGCPYCCTFCVNSTDLRLRKMRSRSVANVIKEVKEFRAIYPKTKTIIFRDDALTAMPLGFIKDLSSVWKKEINLPFSCSGVMAANEDFKEKIAILADAGLRGLKMGIQSGCERVRRKVFARVWETDEVIMKAADILHSFRSQSKKINYYMLSDNPYESEDELAQSVRFTSRIIRPFSLSLYSLNFYPGTVLFNNALRDGHIKNKDDALLESIMDLKNTYLNKVFMSLRYFEVPPIIVNWLTDKKNYSRKNHQIIFNKIFKFLFRFDTPTRSIAKPEARVIGKQIIRGKIIDLWEIARWIVWKPLAGIFLVWHRLAVRPKLVDV